MDKQKFDAIFNTALQQDNLSLFYSNQALAEWHLLTYNELLEVFGSDLDLNYLPEANRKLIYTHYQLQNIAFDRLWWLKYPALLARTAYSLSTLPLYQSARNTRLFYCRLLTCSALATS